MFGGVGEGFRVQASGWTCSLGSYDISHSELQYQNSLSSPERTTRQLLCAYARQPSTATNTPTPMAKDSGNATNYPLA